MKDDILLDDKIMLTLIRPCVRDVERERGIGKSSIPILIGPKFLSDNLNIQEHNTFTFAKLFTAIEIYRNSRREQTETQQLQREKLIKIQTIHRKSKINKTDGINPYEKP